MAVSPAVAAPAMAMAAAMVALAALAMVDRARLQLHLAQAATHTATVTLCSVAPVSQVEVLAATRCSMTCSQRGHSRSQAHRVIAVGTQPQPMLAQSIARIKQWEYDPTCRCSVHGEAFTYAKVKTGVNCKGGDALQGRKVSRYGRFVYSRSPDRTDYLLKMYRQPISLYIREDAASEGSASYFTAV